MIFPCQSQFFLLRKVLAQSGLDRFQFGLFLPGVLPLRFHSLIQPPGQKIVHALKKTGQTELFLKIVEQIPRSELPFTRPQKRKLKTVLAAHACCRALDRDFKTAIEAERKFCTGIAGDFLHSFKQTIFYLFAVLCCQCLAVSRQLHQDFFFPLFHDRAGMGIPAADVFRIQSFLFGKPCFRGSKILEAVAHPMLAALMLRIQGFQLAQIGGKLYLHENKRITGCCGFHFGGVGSFRGHIVNDALEQIALAKLFNSG